MNILLAIWKGETMSVPESLGVAVVGILVVLAELALLALFIMILSKVVVAFASRRKTSEPAVISTVSATPSGTPLPDTQSEGRLDLINVDEPTAATIMAIVSNESGIPLNRLSFKSIKLMEDK